jgi:undecaprenyl-diphosphatase
VLRALSVYGFFAVMLARSIERDWRWLNYGLVAILTTAIALARIYLGAEWLTDVLGSLLLGLAWISGLGIAYHHHTRAETHPYQLGIVALSVLALDLGTHAWLYQRDEILRYQPRPAMIQLSAANWRQGSVEDLPAYRRDIRNQRDQPLDIQYAGDPERLAHTLQQHGWKPAEMLQGANLLRLLSPSLPLQRLPVLPQVHDGRHERLVLEQPQPDGGRLVLRLWASPIRLEPGDRPLWLGSVSSQRKTVVLNLLSYPVTEQDFDAALAQLRRDLEGSEIHVKTERRGRLLLSDR